QTVYAVAWTLGVEATFYVVVPLVALLVARRSRHVLRPSVLVAGLLIVGGASLATGTVHTSVRMDLTLLGTFGYFAPGIIVAVVEHAVRSGRWRIPSALRLSST